MYKKLNFEEFSVELKRAGVAEKFSEHGMRALFNHYEAMEKKTNTGLCIDPEAIKLDFAEYSSITAFNEAKHVFDIEAATLLLCNKTLDDFHDVFLNKITANYDTIVISNSNRFIICQ